MSEETTYDVTGFGETMLRLSVPRGIRLAQMDSLDVHLGGAESNVLAVLAGLGHRCGWFGGLPEGEIGRYAIRQLREFNIEPNPTLVPNSRLGTYYVEFAAPPRSIQVIYDRANSAITQLDPEQFDYDRLLNTKLLHLTGITPALSPNCLTIVAELIKRAKSAAIPISFDVNFRSKLWSAKEASATLLPLLQNIDLLMCGQRDAMSLFDCHGSSRNIITQLVAQTHAKQVVVSIGDEGVLGWDGSEFHHVPAVPVEIVDRVGAGDALAGGIIKGWLEGDFVKGLQYGTLFAGLALSQHGDMTLVSTEETVTLLATVGSKGKTDIAR